MPAAAEHAPAGPSDIGMRACWSCSTFLFPTPCRCMHVQRVYSCHAVTLRCKLVCTCHLPAVRAHCPPWCACSVLQCTMSVLERDALLSCALCSPFITVVYEKAAAPFG